MSQAVQSIAETRIQILAWGLTVWLAAVGAGFALLKGYGSLGLSDTGRQVFFVVIVAAAPCMSLFVDFYLGAFQRQLTDRNGLLETLVNDYYPSLLDEYKGDPIDDRRNRLLAQLTAHRFGITGTLEKWAWRDSIRKPAFWYTYLYALMLGATLVAGMIVRTSSQ